MNPNRGPRMPYSPLNSALFPKSSWFSGGIFLRPPYFRGAEKALPAAELFSGSATDGTLLEIFFRWRSFFLERPVDEPSKKSSFAAEAFFLDGRFSGSRKKLLSRRSFFSAPRFFSAPEKSSFAGVAFSRSPFFRVHPKKASPLTEDFSRVPDFRPQEKSFAQRGRFSRPDFRLAKKSSAVGVTLLEQPGGPHPRKSLAAGRSFQKTCPKQAATRLWR